MPGREPRSPARHGTLWTVVVAGLLSALVAVPLTGADAAPAPPVSDQQAFDSRPAQEALQRLIGQSRAQQVSLRGIDKGVGPDRFRISAVGSQLVVEGTTPAVQLTGFDWYLKYVAHADIAITGQQLDLPKRLPLPDQPIEKNSSVQHRFALNDTNEG